MLNTPSYFRAHELEVTVYPRVLCDTMYNASHNFAVLIAWKMLTPMYSPMYSAYQIYDFVCKTASAWQVPNLSSSHMTWSVLL